MPALPKTAGKMPALPKRKLTKLLRRGEAGEEGFVEGVVAERVEVGGLLEEGAVFEAEAEGALEGAEGVGLVAGASVGAGLLEMGEGRIGEESGGELEAGGGEERVAGVEAELAELGGGEVGLGVSAAGGGDEVGRGGLREAGIEVAGLGLELSEEVFALVRGAEKRNEVG